MPQQRERAGPVERELVVTAEFRSALRQFLRRSEEASLANGLTPQRYDLLLQIKASASGTGESTVTELSRRLSLAQPAVTELVKRAQQAGLLHRRQDRSDGRVFRLSLTREGERRLIATFTSLREDRRALVDAFRRAARQLDSQGS